MTRSRMYYDDDLRTRAKHYYDGCGMVTRVECYACGHVGHEDQFLQVDGLEFCLSCVGCWECGADAADEELHFNDGRLQCLECAEHEHP